ncbi:hypothetical protein [Senegalia massiliensis]|uniref:Uncharacterized protein n=1 Tax=Senegalia massiliensis TaxID=1720316 RepID=A0A845QYP0_9CLOT|nr:hypothetical protein [Senegalia massiliensis]NBI06278.1 hypothetical protein [Senegalia massiliensis]
MKKIYILDLVLLVSIITYFFSYSFLNYISNQALLISALYLASQIFINRKLKIIIRYTPEFAVSWKEYISLFYLLIGKIRFLLALFDDIKSSYWSIIFFGIMSFFIFNYSYISKEKLISNLNKIIDIDKIRDVEVYDKLYGIIYMDIYFKNKNEAKIKLTQKEYQYLKNKT